MTIFKTFTDASDSFVVSLVQTYDLDFRAGADWLRVTRGTTTAHMGLGDDRVRVDGGSVNVFGEDGADRFDLFGGVATADGGADSDRFNIFGGAGHLLSGGGGDDAFVFYGGITGVQLAGDDGNDRFYGNHFAIAGHVQGGTGDDAFYDFADTGGLDVILEGGAGNDLYRVLSASGPSISEESGEGRDTVQVARGLNYTLGANLDNLRVLDSVGAGEDATLSGNGLSNLITGSSGRDILNGLAGNDRLVGGAGNDVVNGGDGNDRITGGLGADVLTGGAGSDMFVYSSLSDSPLGGADTIKDWSAADRLDLSAIDANALLAGNQAFQVYWTGFEGMPPTHTNPGDLSITAFGGEIYITAYTDNVPGADLIITCWCDAGLSALKPENIIA